MFQAFTNKVVTGIISLSMVLFSSYKGNPAKFENLMLDNSINGIAIEASLSDAFENDFEDVFKSGSSVRVFFELKILEDKNELYSSNFSHMVLFDTQTKLFTLELEEQDLTLTELPYKRMLEQLAHISCDVDEILPSTIMIVLTSYLPKMRLESVDQEYDMMILWNMKRPTIKRQFNI